MGRPFPGPSPSRADPLSPAPRPPCGSSFLRALSVALGRPVGCPSPVPSPPCPARPPVSDPSLGTSPPRPSPRRLLEGPRRSFGHSSAREPFKVKHIVGNGAPTSVLAVRKLFEKVFDVGEPSAAPCRGSVGPRRKGSPLWTPLGRGSPSSAPAPGRVEVDGAPTARSWGAARGIRRAAWTAAWGGGRAREVVLGGRVLGAGLGPAACGVGRGRHEAHEGRRERRRLTRATGARVFGAAPPRALVRGRAGRGLDTPRGGRSTAVGPEPDPPPP